MLIRRCLLFILLGAAIASDLSAQKTKTITPALDAKVHNIPESLFNGMRWRNIGPFRGGRVLAVAGIAGDPNTYFFGGVAGGVWKSTDGGGNWKPLFEKEGTSSIGALAVADSDHNVLYVGTGEGCIRGNMSYGDGVYRSSDGGQHWKNVGLRDSQHIGALIVHPKNPDIVLVAALGHAYGPSPERGIFRTADGGKSWQKVLYVDDKSGGIDVVFDPHNPEIVFASIWQVVRTPYGLTSGGPGSGIYKSLDGGLSWARLKGSGLPGGIWGRSGIAVSGGDSNRVYALIEAEKGGLFRSDDAGQTWTRINDDDRFRQRAWYFTHIFADPINADTVYVLNTGAFRSTDGGKTFSLLPAPHGDHHGLWIDPANPQRMINSNDGGVTITTDGGKTWTPQENQPTAQFYHVTADNRYPYYLYGAQQDNSTVAIASRGDEGYIGRQHWYPVGGGESGYIAPDHRDANIVYAGSDSGAITRFDKRTEFAQDISIWPLDVSGQGAAELEHRFQWTAPLLASAHAPDVLYAAGEAVFKTTDHGVHWTPISPDLSRNDKSRQKPSGGPITLDITSVEYYDTVFALAESPLKPGFIWAGTDDGLIHLTQDDGKTWSNVTSKQWPEWSMISVIEPSHDQVGSAMVAIDDHKLDDLRPYIYKTADFGKTWTPITDGIPTGAYVHSVRQDPKQPTLLFAGTELGVYVSFNGGEHWQPLQLNLPRTPITDLVIKDDDLAVSTNGRSFWILDDISPLRQLKAESADQDVILYQPGATYRLYFPEQVDKRRPVGENPPNGAIISYYLRNEENQEITLEIRDDKDKIVRKYSSKEKKTSEQPDEWPDQERPPELLPSKAGMNRFPWNLRYESPLDLPGAFYSDIGPQGPIAQPGVYQLRLTVNGKSQTSTIQIKMDPRNQASAEDVQKQFALSMQVANKISELHRSVLQIRQVRDRLHALKSRLEDKKSGQDGLLASIASFEKKMDAIEQELVQVNMKSSEGNLKFPNMLNEQLDSFSRSIENDAAPTAAMYAVFDRLSQRMEKQMMLWKQLVAAEVPALNQQIQKENVAAIDIAE